jgi:hypothetical protein
MATTEPDVMWTYIRASHMYEIIRGSSAGFKVLIVDACQSQYLERLGDDGQPDEQVVLNLIADRREQRALRSCVLTAVDPVSSERSLQAVPACTRLTGAAAGCTAYLGHIIQVLTEGIAGPAEFLNLRQIVSAVRSDIHECNEAGFPHPISNMMPNLPAPFGLARSMAVTSRVAFVSVQP